eukprot:7379024-Prymnesium_polylepis.1
MRADSFHPRATGRAPGAGPTAPLLTRARRQAAAAAAAAQRAADYRAAIRAGDIRHQADLASRAAWDALPPFAQPALPVARPAWAHGPAVAGEWDAIDQLSVLECLILPCRHLTRVPAGLEVQWARANVDVFAYISDALRVADPVGLERGLK